jgi:microcystin-dependent protein
MYAKLGLFAFSKTFFNLSPNAYLRRTMEGIIGMIKMFAVDTPPADWMLCHGQSLSVAAYPDLFAVLGHRFGGEGDHFSLPDIPRDAAGFFVIRVLADPGQQAFRGMVSQIVLYPGHDIPSGWVICDGSYQSPAQYPVLAKLMAGNTIVDQKGNFAVPSIPSSNGVHYIICAEGVDPTTLDNDDDDY